MKMLNELLNKKCIVRCDRSGVYFGTTTEISNDGKLVKIENVRMLHYYDGAASTLQLADDGTSAPDNCRFTKVISSIVVTDAIAIIPCTDKAITSLEGVKEWTR